MEEAACGKADLAKLGWTCADATDPACGAMFFPFGAKESRGSVLREGRTCNKIVLSIRSHFERAIFRPPCHTGIGAPGYQIPIPSTNTYIQTGHKKNPTPPTTPS